MSASFTKETLCTFDGASFEREDEDAADAVDGLLAGVVTVRVGTLRSGWPPLTVSPRSSSQRQPCMILKRECHFCFLPSAENRVCYWVSTNRK